MSLLPSQYIRRLVPLWRNSRQLVGSAEYCSHKKKTTKRPKDNICHELLAEWKHNKSVGTTTDLLFNAIASGDKEIAAQVTQYLSAQSAEMPPLAQATLSRLNSPSSDLHENSNELHSLANKMLLSPQRIIANARKKLVRNPANVLACLDMSRAYSTLGLVDKSKVLAERALHFAPNHRYVIRNVARQYLQHESDPLVAYRLIERNPATKYDPWLLAAESSLALVADKRPKYYREAQAMLKAEQYSDEHLSELRGAIGTLYFFDGSSRKSRAYLRDSLKFPTENSLAQTIWVNSKQGGIELNDDMLHLRASHEARYFQNTEQGKWQEALIECIRWMQEEPYTTRPARMAGNLCISVVGDHKLAIEVANLGLRIAHNNELLNIKTIAHAYEGEISNAINAFNTITVNDSYKLPDYVYIATAGLLHFRTYEEVRGRELYKVAEAKAPSATKRLVRLFRAREEIAYNGGKPNSYVEGVISESIPHADLWSKQLQHLLRERAKNSTLEQLQPTNSLSKMNTAIDLSLSLKLE